MLSPCALLSPNLQCLPIQELSAPCFLDLGGGFITLVWLTKSLVIGDWFNLQARSLPWRSRAGLSSYSYFAGSRGNLHLTSGEGQKSPYLHNRRHLCCSPCLGNSKDLEGNSTPFQYSCLENPMDGGAWEAAVHGVAKSRTWLSDFTFHFHALEKEMATCSSVLAWRIPGMGEPDGLLSMGSNRVTTEVT